MKQYKYTINGAQYDVTIDSIVGSKAKVEVNGIPFEVEMHGSSLVEEDLPTMSTEGAPAPAAAPAAPAAAPAAAAPAAKSGPGAGTPVKKCVQYGAVSCSSIVLKRASRKQSHIA